ncbi:MAG TPA: helix-turn-helix domain-containing protein [Candidatus Kapabacteria bacterium]|nr:helix-turn-helix domain-containing protein [Candidatus Kapabacteria bacterium]
MRFLLALKEDPLVKADALVGELGLSDRTIRRWWRTYNSQGLAAFLDHAGAMPAVAETQTAYEDDGAASLMELLNSLPLSYDFGQWRESVETALKRYLNGVTSVELHFASPNGSQSKVPTDEASTHTRAALDIPVGDDGTLGTLRIFASEASTIESATKLLDELGPFLTFLYSDAIARSRVLRSLPETYLAELPDGPLVHSLSPRERDVLMHRLYGYTYSEAAERLGVSEETIRKCVKNIYRKTSTTSIGELFVRYFASVSEGPLP